MINDLEKADECFNNVDFVSNQYEMIKDFQLLLSKIFKPLLILYFPLKNNPRQIVTVISKVVAEVNVVSILNRLLENLRISYKISQVMIEEIDTENDPIYYLGVQGVRSEFVVPLKIKNKIIGVLDIQSKRIDDFLETTRKIIESFAALIAISVENKRLFEETKRLSMIDGLTGVLNRRTLEEELEKKTNLYNNKNFLVFFFLDIDNFKKFNDTFGHILGDEALKFFSKIIKKKFKKGVCGRYGGDEFVCATIVKSFSEAKYIAREIIKEVRVSKKAKGLGVSIGISLFNRDGKTVDELISSADKKCYFAKRMGGNRFKF